MRNRRWCAVVLWASAGFLGMYNDNVRADASQQHPPAVVYISADHLNSVKQNSAQPGIPNPQMLDLPPVGGDTAKRLGLRYLLAQRTTNYHHASLSQTKNIELVAKRLNGRVIRPNEIFSYYKQVGPYTQENGYQWGRAFVQDRIVPSMGGGVCQGASTLYSALLRTDLPIVERHQHSLTVPYLPPGEDATVASDYKDFKFRNNQSRPILITSATDSNKRLFTVAVWGAEPSPKIAVHHEIVAKYPYRLVRKCATHLQGTNQRIMFPGQMGVRVKTWVEVQTSHGSKKTDLGTDRYQASPRVLEIQCRR